MNSKIQILPFNLAEEVYADVLDNEYEGEMVTQIIIIQSAGVLTPMINARRHEIAMALKPVVNMLDHAPMPRGGRVMTDYCVTRASHGLWSLLSPAQQEWLTDDCYVQVGFYPADIICDADLGGSIGNSLALYDFLVARHHSVETMDHQPIKLPSNQIRELSIGMGNVCENGMAFLPRHLLPFRNTVAVMARAALAGQDPVATYHSFLEKSHRHFLGVEMIPFTHEKDMFTVDGLEIAVRHSDSSE